VDYALLLVAPIVALFIVAKALGDRPMTHLGPWVIVVTGIWGACTESPLQLLPRHDVPTIAAGIAFLAAGLVFSTIVWRGAPKSGTDALLPFGLWWVTALVAYKLGSSFVMAATQPGGGLDAIGDAPRVTFVVLFLVLGTAAALTSSAR